MLNLTTESSDCMLVALVKVSTEVLDIPRRSGQCTILPSAPTTADSNVSGGYVLPNRIYHTQQGV
jgi:hypothetical protein